MLLELSGDGTVLTPVAAVVRPHGEFVDQQTLVRGLEQLDGQHPGHTQPFRDARADRGRDLREPGAAVRGRCDHLGAHAAALHRLDDGIRAQLTGGTARDLLRQFAREVDELFGQQRAAVEPVGDLGGIADDPHALAVVTASRRLDDHAPAVGVEEALQLGGVGDGRPFRLRHTELGQARSHRELVLRELERVGTGVHADAVGHQRPQHVLRDVFVVEGDDVDVASECADGVEVAVVADGGRRERGGHPLFFGEHAHADAELHRRSDHHPGELPAAHDAEGECHGAPFRRIHLLSSRGTRTPACAQRRSRPAVRIAISAAAAADRR